MVVAVSEGEPIWSTYPEKRFHKALLADWTEADDCSLTAAIIHAANALKSLCSRCVPHTQGKHPPILHCHLSAPNTCRSGGARFVVAANFILLPYAIYSAGAHERTCKQATIGAWWPHLLRRKCSSYGVSWLTFEVAVYVSIKQTRLACTTRRTVALKCMFERAIQRKWPRTNALLSKQDHLHVNPSHRYGQEVLA